MQSFERNLHVCPKCDHHQRITARVRLENFLDENDDRQEIATDVQPVEHIKVLKTVRNIKIV